MLSLFDQAWRLSAETAQALGGGIAHVFGAGRARWPYLDAAAQARLRLLDQVKRKLDPAGILNPGILGTEP